MGDMRRRSGGGTGSFWGGARSGLRRHRQRLGIVGGGRRGGRLAIGLAFEFLGRSEEHTSELQSLMRISYAVFCLKKKNQNRYNHYQTTEQNNATQAHN